MPTSVEVLKDWEDMEAGQGQLVIEHYRTVQQDSEFERQSVAQPRKVPTEDGIFLSSFMLVPLVSTSDGVAVTGGSKCEESPLGASGINVLLSPVLL